MDHKEKIILVAFVLMLLSLVALTIYGKDAERPPSVVDQQLRVQQEILLELREVRRELEHMRKP